MGGDDDIAAALPRPPLPAPARREAALAEALRRFDGADPVSDAQERGLGRTAPWWSAKGRPYAGALAGAFLAAVIGLPFVWTSFDHSVADGSRERPPAAESAAAGPAMADADASGDPLPPDRAADADASPVADQVAAGDPAGPARAGPSSSPARPAGEGPVGRSEAFADAGSEETGEVVVTGSRIRHPNLSSSSPVAVVGGDDAITVTGTRSAYAGSRRRGDWNACTVDDPARDAEACRNRAGPAAKSGSGRAGSLVAEGVSKAWEGELDEAVASFDRAIQLAPRSSAAYLNRALARRRSGDLDGALADLDRAVRFSPRGARFYYHRSLVLHQRGDKRRALADEERAVDLDPRYAAIVKRSR
jgi:hypothetical protein